MYKVISALKAKEMSKEQRNSIMSRKLQDVMEIIYDAIDKGENKATISEHYCPIDNESIEYLEELGYKCSYDEFDQYTISW